MTGLRDGLGRLLDDEPDAPYDIDTIVRSGRRARRRRQLAVAAVGTVGVAGVTAAVVVPVVASGGDDASVAVGARPAPTSAHAAPAGKCFVLAAKPKGVQHVIARLARREHLGTHPTVVRVLPRLQGGRHVLEVCTEGTSPKDLQGQHPDSSATPSGPRYHYSEQPDVIASRLAAHLQQRIESYGLSISFTRPFGQESSDVEHRRPTYFGGNVDVHESSGYADIGVQVTHAVSEFVPFTGDCTATEHCTQTRLSDGSVLRTGRVSAGKGLVILTAEVHRPDGVVVQAQESNYPFGPDAGSQPHGEQPLTIEQLSTLAADDAFAF